MRKNFYLITLINLKFEMFSMLGIKVIEKLDNIIYWKKPEEQFGDKKKWDLNI